MIFLETCVKLELKWGILLQTVDNTFPEMILSNIGNGRLILEPLGS